MSWLDRKLQILLLRAQLARSLAEREWLLLRVAAAAYRSARRRSGRAGDVYAAMDAELRARAGRPEGGP